MQEKIKNILMVVHYYPPHMGGIEVVARNQATRLAAMGHKVTVITSKVDSEEKIAATGSVTILRIPVFNGFEKWGIPFPIFSPTLLITAIRYVREVDIVHIHDAFYMSSLVSALCAWWYGKPVVLMQHVAMIDHQNKVVILIQKLVYATTGALIFNISRRIITVNDRVNQFLIQHGVSSEKLVALASGVDFNLFHSANTGDKEVLKRKFGLKLDRKILLFVGRFVHKKGFNLLLEARSDKYQIVFAGGKADPLKKDDGGLIFLGKLEPAVLAEVYRAADIFILPSRDEGFPLSMQEAMASGLPIIATNDKGYGRYNLDSKLMVLIDEPNEESVRVGIESIIYNETLLKEMASYSEEYARKNFDWGLLISKLDCIYDDLLVERV